ncbi:unnamed protein product, partial [Laminaria digitata]
AKRVSSTATRTASAAAVTTTMLLAVDPSLPSSQSPAIIAKHALRRPSIELDATMSRSSRLPPASTLLYTSSSSSTALSGSAPNYSVTVKSRGGSRSAESVEAHQTPGRIFLPKDRKTNVGGDASLSVIETPDEGALPSDNLADAAPPSINDATIGTTSSSFRASTRSEGVSTTSREFGVRGKGNRASSRKTRHRHHHRTRRGTKHKRQKQQQHHQQQRGGQSGASSSADGLKKNYSAHSGGRLSAQQQARAKLE